jgi:hypothetical protein
VGWCGTPRTQPDVRGNETVAGQKAAITALLGGYYLMRAGATYPCHAHYDSKTPGDAWPGGAKNAIIFFGVSPMFVPSLSWQNDRLYI